MHARPPATRNPVERPPKCKARMTKDPSGTPVSKSNFKCMIYKFIYIKHLKFIQCVSKREIFRNKPLFENRKYMGCSNNSVKMNYRGDGSSIICHLMFYNPHASAAIH